MKSNENTTGVNFLILGMIFCVIPCMVAIVRGDWLLLISGLIGMVMLGLAYSEVRAHFEKKEIDPAFFEETTSANEEVLRLRILHDDLGTIDSRVIELANLHGGIWGEHKDYPLDAWIEKVKTEETADSYWIWVWTNCIYFEDNEDCDFSLEEWEEFSFEEWEKDVRSNNTRIHYKTWVREQRVAFM
ncbi:MAG: hypothetical protein VYB54_10420 [Pseudomonadota bacterium]|nr:hypothetical protein [Pseudomonadota bacterium]